MKYNIRVNAVSPVASTRLTEPLWPAEVSNALKPELTAPIIVYLCHPSCPEAGSLFEVPLDVQDVTMPSMSPLRCANTLSSLSLH